MFKNQKGITLVSLVITIIVMLILAGVSIAMVLGDNGVLTQGTRSVERTTLSALEEEASNAVIAVSTEGYGIWAETGADIRDYVTIQRINDQLALAGSNLVLQGTATDTFTTGTGIAVTFTNGAVSYDATVTSASNGALSVDKGCFIALNSTIGNTP